MTKLFISQKQHDKISDSLGISRIKLDSPLVYEIEEKDLIRGGSCVFKGKPSGQNQKGENNHHYGYKHSEETKKFLSQIAKMRKCSPRTGKNILQKLKKKLDKKL